VSLSPEQVYRASWLAAEVERTNVFFRVMDALALEFADKTFDLVWACESGEHMPDKKKYVDSMTRVLKPGALQFIPPCWVLQFFIRSTQLFTEL
jgi:MPBQ/MSBQ methyltransferase